MARNPLIPLLSSTFLPPNHATATDTPEHKSFVINYLAEEERLGRMSAPYPEDIIRQCYGHIRSSPLGVIDKATPPGQPQKYRLITDASYRDSHDISTNDFIDSDEFPTRWHGVDVIANMVSALPPLFDKAFLSVMVIPTSRQTITAHVPYMVDLRLLRLTEGFRSCTCGNIVSYSSWSADCPATCCFSLSH